MYKHKYNKTILDLKIRNTKSPDIFISKIMPKIYKKCDLIVQFITQI